MAVALLLRLPYEIQRMTERGLVVYEEPSGAGVRVETAVGVVCCLACREDACSHSSLAVPRGPLVLGEAVQHRRGHGMPRFNGIRDSLK